MADSGNLKLLILTGVKDTGRYIGRGSCGRLFEVNYKGTKYAAKSGALVYGVISEVTKQILMKESLLHSQLDHPNIVKMLGVFYPSDRYVLPVLVMELMKCSLHRLLVICNDIPKLSILQDVSRGVYYLHTLNPPVIHCNLSSKNVFISSKLVAKIGNFESAQSPSDLTMQHACPGDIILMPPEALTKNPHYGLPLDIFSFGCVVCHVISQQWPAPVVPTAIEVQQRQCYIDQISDRSLKQLVISCLNNNPERRPPISQVCGRITSIITGELTCMYFISVYSVMCQP